MSEFIKTFMSFKLSYGTRLSSNPECLQEIDEEINTYAKENDLSVSKVNWDIVHEEPITVNHSKTIYMVATAHFTEKNSKEK